MMWFDTVNLMSLIDAIKFCRNFPLIFKKLNPSHKAVNFFLCLALNNIFGSGDCCLLVKNTAA